MRNRIDRNELPFSDKYILLMMLPMLGETFLNVAIGIFDTMMVSSAGEAAISGVSVVDSLILLFTLVFTCFSSGGAVIFSQYLGARDSSNAEKSSRLLVQLAFLIGLVLAILIFFLRGFLLHLLLGNAEASVYEAAEDYLIPLSLSLPFLALISSATALSRSMGKSRIAMLIALLMNVVNIGGNAILIYVFDMGAGGAGIASLVARIVASIVMLLVLRSDSLPIRIGNLLEFRPDRRLVRNILYIAVPSAVENCVFHLGKLIIVGIVASLGTTAMAANAAVNSIASFMALPGSAMNMAIIPLVSHCCGAGRYDEAGYYSKKVLMWEYVAFSIVNIPMLFLRDPLLGLFHLGPEAMELARYCFMLQCIHIILMWPPSFGLPSCLESAGDVIFPMVLSILSMWIFRVGSGYLLGIVMGYGLIGVAWAMFFDWYCRIIFLVGRFVSGKWKNRKVI